MECSICLEIINQNFITLECKHIFHKNCLKQLRKWNCPICRRDINIQKAFNINHYICNGDVIKHYGFGYSPVIPNGYCRFCNGKPLFNI